MADRYGPVSMPDREWRKPEIRHALRERDAGALLGLVQKHAGVSQARLATATGIGQGRLNEIINGHRQVARLDVLERIAGGLAMPDDARVLFGLAPVHADTLTGHAEISRVFTGQAEANAELREQAVSAGRIDVLAVRALGLIALNDSLLRGPLAAGRSAINRRRARAAAGSGLARGGDPGRGDRRVSGLVRGRDPAGARPAGRVRRSSLRPDAHRAVRLAADLAHAGLRRHAVPVGVCLFLRGAPVRHVQAHRRW